MEMYGSKWMKRQGTSVMSDLLTLFLFDKNFKSFSH